MRQTISAQRLCLAAMAVCINLAGGQLALALRLPVYLDSVGTIMTGALLGPWYGMLPNLLSGVLMGMTTDIYSLYFAPVGMLTGIMAGVVLHGAAGPNTGWKRLILPTVPETGQRRLISPAGMELRWSSLFLPAALVTVPGTIVSSVICAVLFGGITSSGSTILVQLLAKTPLGMTASVFLVQIATDYLDRLISIFAVAWVLRAIPADMRRRMIR